MRILLVEDDPMIAEAVKGALTDEMHAVQHVSNGKNALAQLGLNNYQMVLLDLGLPGLDGMSILESHSRARRTTCPSSFLSAAWMRSTIASRAWTQGRTTTS